MKSRAERKGDPASDSADEDIVNENFPSVSTIESFVVDRLPQQ
jgi:hypothetical protein